MPCGCSPFKFCSSPLTPGLLPPDSSCLFSQDIDGMDRPIAVKGGATTNSPSELLSIGAREYSIVAGRMSERSAKKIVTCLQRPFKYCRICAITRCMSMFCFRMRPSKTCSPVDSSKKSRDDSPLKTVTLCVGVMLTVVTFDCSCESTRRSQDLPGLMIRGFSSMILTMVNKQDYVN